MLQNRLNVVVFLFVAYLDFNVCQGQGVCLGRTDSSYLLLWPAVKLLFVRKTEAKLLPERASKSRELDFKSLLKLQQSSSAGCQCLVFLDTFCLYVPSLPLLKANSMSSLVTSQTKFFFFFLIKTKVTPRSLVITGCRNRTDLHV